MFPIWTNCCVLNCCTVSFGYRSVSYVGLLSPSWSHEFSGCQVSRLWLLTTSKMSKAVWLLQLGSGFWHKGDVNFSWFPPIIPIHWYKTSELDLAWGNCISYILLCNKLPQTQELKTIINNISEFRWVGNSEVAELGGSNQGPVMTLQSICWLGLEPSKALTKPGRSTVRTAHSCYWRVGDHCQDALVPPTWTLPLGCLSALPTRQPDSPSTPRESETEATVAFTTWPQGPHSLSVMFVICYWWHKAALLGVGGGYARNEYQVARLTGGHLGGRMPTTAAHLSV